MKELISYHSNAMINKGPKLFVKLFGPLHESFLQLLLSHTIITMGLFDYILV